MLNVDLEKMSDSELVGLGAAVGAELEDRGKITTVSKSEPPTPAGEGTYDVQIDVPLIKVDEEKRLVTGVVLEPEEVDAHGDFEKADTIQRAAHKFLSEFNKRTKMGIQHAVFGDVGVDLVESFIAPIDLSFPGHDVVKAGSWVMVVKILDDTLWQSIKAGAITGFSIGGVATVAGKA